MKQRILPRLLVVMLVVGLLFVVPADQPASASSLLTPSQMNQIQRRILSGFASFELDPGNATNAQLPKNYQPHGSGDCVLNLASNVKVNQNCLNISDPDLQGRGQSQNETFIAQDPNQPNHIVASSNDYRRGDSTCGTYWSVDSGRTWNDSTLPNGFVRGQGFGGVAREYFQAGGDTSVAWDTKGNAYILCQMFKRGYGTTNDTDTSSGLYLYRSTQNFGASWNFPGRPAFQFYDRTGLVLVDKPFMTVDNHAGSPFQDRIYVTWTLFDSDGSAYIFESYSADYGETFSAPKIVSADHPLCVNTYGVPTAYGRCNENQFSQPFTGPDGALYVTYANFNNAVSAATDNRNQIFIAKSVDGGNTFSAPVKVSDYYDLPDCATYQAGKDAGRACVPEKGPSTDSFFRATNYPSGQVNPTNPAQVIVTFGSYINVHSNEANGCIPAGFSPFGQDLYTGVKTPGACNNDILISISNNSGATFTGTTADPRVLTTVTQDPGQATTDQWFQWTAFNKNGKLAVSYYDRQYGDDETTGFSDFSLSGTGDLARYVVQRATSGSMPPPTQFSGTFWGDYTGLTAVTNAYPIWSDTRSPELFTCRDSSGNVTLPPSLCTGTAGNASIANDQDVYVAALPIPSK